MPASRALLFHFSPCVEDNFNSIDGPLDVNEPFVRATAAGIPDRLALTFDLLQARAEMREDDMSMWVWDTTPFPRITLDLGPTGNALRVLGELVAAHPDQRTGLLAVAKRRATSTAPPHRRARWAALAAYLDAGVPDPGVPPEAGLARALGADAASARWALGLIPNELEEHAPRPFPYVRDVALTKAIAARSEAVETDEDTVLALDASSLAAPGTGLALAVRATSSPQPGVQRAAMAAMKRQIQQLDGAGRAHALFAPHMADLRRGLVSRVCTSTEVLSFLAAAGDDALDTEASSCLTSNPDPGTSYLHELFGQCMAREFGMSKTASALEAIAKPGEEGDYTRRVARGCKTGKN
jgi:hypothetical protein